MKTPSEGRLLRIFVDETDRWHGHSLYSAIVHKAKEEGMAGATVLKGIMGFGCRSRASKDVLRLSENLPIVIEIVDSEENINKFLPSLDEMVREGLITMEKANVIMYQSDKG